MTMDSPTTFLPEFGSTPTEPEPPHPEPLPAPDAQLSELQGGLNDSEPEPPSSQDAPSEDTPSTEVADEPASAIRLVTKAMITGPPGSTPPLRIVSINDVLPSVLNQY